MRIKLSTLQKIIAEATENAYAVLGLQPGASKKEILNAWRQLVFAARQARGGGRGGHQAAEINLYLRAVNAALSNLEDPSAPLDFEPRAVKPPPEPKAPRAAAAAGGDPNDLSDIPFADPGDRKMRKAKASGKVYYGKYGKDGAKRSVVRVQKKLYGTGPDGILGTGDPTMFGGGDVVGLDLSPDYDGRLRVSDGGHDQMWDPIDEVRKVVDELVIESLMQKIG